jgi:hypothetical protein
VTDQDIIEAIEQHRLQRAAQQMQGMVASAMFGTQAAAPPSSSRPSMQEIIAQVEAADRRSTMNFQDPQDQQAQAVLGILLDL